MVLSLFRRRTLERALETRSARISLMSAGAEFAPGNDAEAHMKQFREFGGVVARPGRGTTAHRRGILPWIESALRDARYAARSAAQFMDLRRQRLLSGDRDRANTAIFRCFTRVLRRFRLARPEELVVFLSRADGDGVPLSGGCTGGPSQTISFRDVARRGGVDNGRCGRVASARLGIAPATEFISGTTSDARRSSDVGRSSPKTTNRTPRAHPLAVLTYDSWSQTAARRSRRGRP